VRFCPQIWLKIKIIRQNAPIFLVAILGILHGGRLLQDQPKIKHFIANALAFASLR
jgi:hypothetical protein